MLRLNKDLAMDYSVHKQRLIEMEERLTSRKEVNQALIHQHSEKDVGDSGDASAATQNVELGVAKAELGSAVLAQVRDALQRIDAGTFGTCAVDGEPIDPKRLEAAPWVPYCLKHQELLEAGAGNAPAT